MNFASDLPRPMEKEMNYYKSLPYNYIIQPMNDESGHYYYGHVLELDGCQSTGATADEAMEGLQEALEGYIETKLAHHLPVPEPESVDQKYSGRLVLRIPKSLHQRLAIEANTDGTSLNQYLMYKLAK